MPLSKYARMESDNTITFTAGPHEGTVTYEGATSVDFRDKGRNLFYKAFHPELTGDMRTDGMRIESKGSVIFPITTPGDMSRIRCNAFWRARDKQDGYDVEVSYDGGQTFRPVIRLGGPIVGETKYFTISAVPAGTRSAQLRFSGRTVNTTMLFGLRIDADYRQPHGGFRPVKITYVWEENGQSRSDEHVAITPQDRYMIRCGPKTMVRSFAVELAR